LGSFALLVKAVCASWGGFRRSSLGRVEDAEPEQIEAGTAVHLAFDQLQSMNLSFDLTVAPERLQCRQHLGLIADEMGGEAG
jgi:hypothetical protein